MLTVCLADSGSAARNDAVIAPLRRVADEILVLPEGADERDRAKFDWILRLRPTDRVSAALAARLPDLTASTTVGRYAIAQAWCYPDAAHMLDEPPWSSDFEPRLTRGPDGPTAYVAEPIHRFDLLHLDLPERRAIAVREEVQRPHRVAVGGGRPGEAFYLPELRGSLQIRPMDQAHAGGNAMIEPYGGPLRLVAGERAPVFVHVTNDTEQTWPASLDGDPPIRLAYRWHRADGRVHTADGVRSPFPLPVEPGERVLAPLTVFAPEAPGDYVLEVDVVHEHVRWFDRACRIPARVGAQSPLPQVDGRLRASRPPRAARLRRRRIPRVFHRVWLGSGAMPEQMRGYAQTFSQHHPGWELREWTDRDLPALGIGEEEVARARTLAELSNVVRYEVLARYGGVYVDTDVECRRSFEPLLRGVRAFAALELPARIGNAVLGAVPGHPVFVRAAAESRATLGLGAHSADANGPYFLTLLLEQEPGVAILPARHFYPYLWTEPERRDEEFPDAYAVHHWTLSWVSAET